MSYSVQNETSLGSSSSSSTLAESLPHVMLGKHQQDIGRIKRQKSDEEQTILKQEVSRVSVHASLLPTSTRQSSRRKQTPQLALSALADLIKDPSNKQIVFLTGAGLSCASGIPPFRGTKDAIWSQSVYEWGTKAKYLKDPISWYKQFFLKHFVVINSAKPNAGHEAIARICGLFKDRCKVITQNIDMLHSHPHAKVDDNQLIEVHGRANAFKCFTKGCAYSYEKSVATECPVEKETDIPNCPGCGSICCPNTLFFDENYCEHSLYQFDKARDWLDQADVIVFVGTSFAVGITNFAFEAAMERERENPSKPMHLFNFNVSDAIPTGCKTIQTPIQCVKGLCELTLPLLEELLLAKDEH